jgi:hypothetical protein
MADGELAGLSREELLEVIRRQQEELAAREAAIERRDEKIRALEEELLLFRRPAKAPESSSIPPSRGPKANRVAGRHRKPGPKRGHVGVNTELRSRARGPWSDEGAIHTGGPPLRRSGRTEHTLGATLGLVGQRKAFGPPPTNVRHSPQPSYKRMGFTVAPPVGARRWIVIDTDAVSGGGVYVKPVV